MKLRILFAAAVVITFAACKTPYKATDTSTPAVDSSASSMDTTISSNSNTSLKTDSAEVAGKIDSIRMLSTTDSIKTMPAADSTRMPTSFDSSNKLPSTLDSSNRIASPMDSTKMERAIDSTKMTSSMDSTRMPTAADSTKMTSAMDSTKSSSTDKAPEGNVTVDETIKTTFTTQYPGASNIVWAKYDSLAVVPIDLRMAGWKKMDGEDYLVKFDLEDENYYAWYERDGNWVGSAYNMKDFTKLPAAVNTAIKNAIKTRYQDYNITNVNREFQKNKKSYEVELKNADSKVKMLVNADGKITQVFKYVKDKK